MNKTISVAAPEIFLGIEGGATHTVALAVNGAGQVLHRLETGPANLRLLNDAQLTRHFRFFRSRIPSPAAIAIGLAGARTESDFKRIQQAAERVWPRTPCYATGDLETALMAAEERRSEVGGRRSEVRDHAPRSTLHALPRILVLSGTGSCCFGRTPAGKSAKVGGWGHLLADKGSGYQIGLRALKAVVYYYDRDNQWSSLGQSILRALQLNEPNDLIGWVQNASKSDIAALALEVFNAAAERDRIASDILAGAANYLAKDAAACAGRLAKAGTPVQFVLAGGVLLRQPRFAQQVSRQLRQVWPGAVVTPLKRESVWGAVELAKRTFTAQGLESKVDRKQTPGPLGKEIQEQGQSLALSPTEQRNPRSMKLDQLPIGRAIELMLSEDAKIPAAILAERKKIEQAIHWIVRSFRRGGRLFYVGAGTSGRLGVLDASECPPTFRAPPEMVQGIIAGGQRALWEAVEGAEDDSRAGARAIEYRGVGRRDVVFGIAASGRTPFVWGALNAAKQRGAVTILLSFNPNLKIPPAGRPTLVIAPNVGPEVLTGSTRLKAGTATKLILNILTTLAMVRVGKVLGNLMIDVNASNAKLRDRAVRIVQELAKVEDANARAALQKTGWQIRPACAWLKRHQAAKRRSR
jgi:N-acetylmuramic acid 6-phosphate etherase